MAFHCSPQLLQKGTSVPPTLLLPVRIPRGSTLCWQRSPELAPKHRFHGKSHASRIQSPLHMGGGTHVEKSPPTLRPDPANSSPKKGTLGLWTASSSKAQLAWDKTPGEPDPAQPRLHCSPLPQANPAIPAAPSPPGSSPAPLAGCERRQSRSSSCFLQLPLQHGALLPPPGDPPAQHPHPSTLTWGRQHPPGCPPASPGASAGERHPCPHPGGKGKQGLCVPWEGVLGCGGAASREAMLSGRSLLSLRGFSRVCWLCSCKQEGSGGPCKKCCALPGQSLPAEN